MDMGLIKQKIAEDKSKTLSSYRRYPVRFLFMELSNNTQNEILDLVQSSNGELLDLSDYIMKKDDGWLTKSRFFQVIEQYVSKEKDTYVVGFSEMIRFYSKKEIQSTVLSLFDIENDDATEHSNTQRRIYFICFSMMDNVSAVLKNSFSRKELLEPFINVEFEVNGEYREICFVADKFASNIKSNKISTSVDWIGLWRHSEIIDFTQPIWCCSESLFEWHQKASPDNAFQIDIVKDSKGYLQKMYNTYVDFPYESEDELYWKKLLGGFEGAKRGVDIREIVSEILSVDTLKTSSLAAKYLIADDPFDKWLIRNYVMAYIKDSFLCMVLRSLHSNSKKEFLVAIWQQGYRISNTSYLDERIDIIRELNKYADSFTPEKEIRETIIEGVASELCLESLNQDYSSEINLFELSKQSGKSLPELKSRMLAYYTKIFKPAYTGISDSEKEFMINIYSNGVLDKEEIRTTYPLLYAYLFSSGDNLVQAKTEYKYYLNAYRDSKVHHQDNAYLQEYYNSGCANASTLYSMYYDLLKQDNLVMKKADEQTDIYVLDGVGAEYIPLIVELIKQNGYEVDSCDYAAAHLPTITDVNKAYLSAVPYKEWIVDFDKEVIHGELYRTTTNIRKAIDMLERQIREIISESSGKRIIITADHGATARARWTDTKKKYNFLSADHEGRCCKITSKNDYEETADYIVYEDEINPGMPYVISLNETSLYNRPKYEDHGGATFEEVLVPVIVAVPGGEKTAISYKVLDEKLLVNGLDKRVSFIIIPEPVEAYVMEADGTKHVLTKADSLYYADLLSGKEQDIVVIIDDKTFKFHTINTSKKNMEGDDGFDD